MDSFADHEAIIVLIAANRPDVVDLALRRPEGLDSLRSDHDGFGVIPVNPECLFWSTENHRF